MAGISLSGGEVKCLCKSLTGSDLNSLQLCLLAGRTWKGLARHSLGHVKRGRLVYTHTHTHTHHPVPPMPPLVLLLCLLLSSAWAGCPNSCSGHGACGSSDLCSCHRDFQGSDCSQRTCPFGRSWAVDAADPHSFDECSGQGICDR